MDTYPKPHATDIVAYTFQADIFCPSCIRLVACAAFDVKGEPPADAEATLDTLAQLKGLIDGDINGFDRYDEYSFDSGDFPKVVFRLEQEEFCAECHEPIHEVFV